MVAFRRLAASRTKRAIRAKGAFGTLKDHGVVARRAACNRIASPVERNRLRRSAHCAAMRLVSGP